MVEVRPRSVQACQRDALSGCNQPHFPFVITTSPYPELLRRFQSPLPAAADRSVRSKRSQDLLAEVPFPDELSVAVSRCQG
jgi:hypothetical protein